MIVIRDTREKVGFWSFAKFDEVDGETVGKVDEGDYTLFDYPNLITVERKKTALELANNLGKEYERFCREFERMTKYKYKYVICEFSLDEVVDFPHKSKLPFYKLKYIRMNGSFMLKRIDEIEKKYNIQFIFTKNKEEAEEKALELFKEAINGTTS